MYYELDKTKTYEGIHELEYSLGRKGLIDSELEVLSKYAFWKPTVKNLLDREDRESDLERLIVESCDWCNSGCSSCGGCGGGGSGCSGCNSCGGCE